MNLIDPWTHLLKTLDCDYVKLKELVEHGPAISIRLEKRKVLWWICIFEDWDSTPAENQYYTASYDKVGERLDWADTQLKDWKYVLRQSRGNWAFIRQRDAEKFITLFNLRWV